MEELLITPNDSKENPLLNKAILIIQDAYSREEKAHTIRTANTLIQKNLDHTAIIAALLHDMFYKNKMTLEELEQTFGEEITIIVKECARIQEVIDANYKKVPPETLSSLILSISTNIQTIIIKMADIADLLSHPIRTDTKQLIFISKNIYSPLATKLGITDFSWQINDYSFKLENPNGFNKIKTLINKTRAEREEFIDKMKQELEELLKNKVNAQVFGRPKNYLSIYEKMKKIPFKLIHDIYGIRIICNKERECYEILGYIHSHYEFIPQAFDDYIAKEGKGVGKTGYQSLHTAIKKNTDVVEIQIRTWEQHLKTESSIYWEYKRLRKNKDFDKTLSWERQLIEWQKSVGIENKKRKITGNKLYIFTPKNAVIPLPTGSTVIDFAFAIHTDIGSKIKQAKVNDIFVPLDTKLNNLDKVEIITDQKLKVKANWINFVVSEKAKTKIKKYLGIKTMKKIGTQFNESKMKKIKMAECCHPLPGEDVIGIKTTKRKIIIHKKDCENIKNIPLSKKVEIMFEKTKGKTKLNITAIDRIGLLSEILNEFKKNKIEFTSTNFKVKQTGFVQAIFEIEVKNISTLNKLIEKLEEIPSIQRIDRE